MQEREALKKRLEALGSDEERLFNPLERAFGLWCYDYGSKRTELALAAAHVLRAARLGNSCLPIDKLAAEIEEGLPDALFQASPLIGRRDQAESAAPLILDGNRLYIRRYFLYEERLASRLLGFLQEEKDPVSPGGLLPGEGLFEGEGSEKTDWQAVGVFVAERHRFAVLLGGPGTGKTYCVLLLMLRMIESSLKAKRPIPRFQLAAPTGRAAARIMESIMGMLSTVKEQEKTQAGTLSFFLRSLEERIGQGIQDVLPKEAVTLHRLLGLRFSSTLPFYHQENPIPADVVVVDEASMVDLSMMSKLFSAIKPKGRLILLGDPHQLASVETGSVLSDLDRLLDSSGKGLPRNVFSNEQKEALGPLLKADATEAAPSYGFAEVVSDHIVTLQKNRRLTDESLKIGELAKAVNEGKLEESLAMFGKDDAMSPVAFQDTPNPADFKRIVREMAHHYGELLAWPCYLEEVKDILKGRLNEKRLLCVLRRGPAGSETLNLQIQRILATSGRGSKEGSVLPVIITENDYRMKLFNGDTGVVYKEKGERDKAYFLIDGKLEEFFSESLPAYETAYAMTVHKSQGSEFNEVILLLPWQDCPVLTRELLYTAITRAKKRMRILGPEESLIKAIKTRTERYSGLRERLEVLLSGKMG